MRNNESSENYLETILILSKKLPVVRSVDIANELGFKKSSVSIAMKNLREKNNITVSDAGFITLTESGRQIAEMIYERHELLSECLEKLGVDKEIAAEDACRIEPVSYTHLDVYKRQFFIRGGRISKTAGFVGNVLNICPFMNVSNEGKLIVREKIRTKKKAIKEMLVKMQALCKDGADYSDKVYISNSACYEDAKAVADLIEAAFPKMKGKVEINDIGTTIGSHTGPGTVALFFWGNKRED